MNLEDKLTYTVGEVAKLTGLSARTVTRKFQNERGVIVLERPETLHKRRYRTVRIPRMVYERVVQRIPARARKGIDGEIY